MGYYYHDNEDEMEDYLRKRIDTLREEKEQALEQSKKLDPVLQRSQYMKHAIDYLQRDYAIEELFRCLRKYQDI